MDNWEFLIKELVEFLELKKPDDEIIINKYDYRKDGGMRYIEISSKEEGDRVTKRIIENGDAEGHSLW